jgi:asparagine synthase (glutamine-hydrolysing)
VCAGPLLGPALALPGGLRRAVARGLGAVPARHWEWLASRVPAARRPRQPAEKVQRLAAVLAAPAPDLYAQLLAAWPDAPAGRGHARWNFGDDATTARLAPPGARLQYLDSAVYLPDDGLVKVDRATMAASLECRVPLLDHRVVEAAWRLPWPLRVRGLTGKWLLRQVLARHVPPALFARPKSGFALPLAAWLRSGLRDWAESLLAPDRLAATGALDPAAVRALWRDHLDGRVERPHALWNILTLQSWHEHWRR